MNKINAKEIEAGEVVATITKDELDVLRRATCKIDAAKSVIETLTNEISRQYEVIKDVWRRYAYPDDIDAELLKRGMCLSINERTGNIKISKISDGELKKALYHNLLW